MDSHLLRQKGYFRNGRPWERAKAEIWRFRERWGRRKREIWEIRASVETIKAEEVRKRERERSADGSA